MEINCLGHSSFRIRGKKVALVTDPFSPLETGLKFPKTEADIVTVSHNHADHNATALVSGMHQEMPVVISGPGEYEVQGVKITGILSYHDKNKGNDRGRNIIYQFIIDNISIVHLGDLGDKLSSEMVEKLNGTDVLMCPVGGVYTISAKEATGVIAQIEPKVVLPMHYFEPGLKFTLDPIDKFFHEVGIQHHEPLAKLILSKDKLPDKTEFYILKK